MIIGNKIIIAPVSFKDVAKVLGIGTLKEKVLCSSSRINKWTKYKPIVVANTIRRLTYAEFVNAKFGLVPALNTLLRQKSDSGESGTSAVADSDELESVLNSNAQWTYNRPTGTWNAPFRIMDFTQPSDKNEGYGYYHDTPAPVDNVHSKTFSLTAVANCAANTNIGYTAATPAGAWTLDDPNNTSPLFDGMSFRFGSGTQYNIGNADTRAIILNDLLGMADNDCWRLAVAVQVPVSGALSYMRLFTSKMTFYATQQVSESARAQQLMPSLGTNQYLCKLIEDYATYLKNKTTSGNDVLGNAKLTVTNPTFRLPAILCVVKDMYMGGISRNDGGGAYTHCFLQTGSLVYSAPAVISRFEIVINDDKDFSASEVMAYSHLSISVESTGEYIQMGDASYTRVDIRQLRADQLQKVTSDLTIYYRVTYIYVTGFNGARPVTATQTNYGQLTLKAGAEKGSSEWIAMSLAGAPGLQINQKQQSITPINN